MENHFPAVSPLIAPELAQQLKALLGNLQEQVHLTCMVDDSDKSCEMGAFVNHLVGLSDKLSCSFLNPEESPEAAAALDATMLPATGIGVPGGLPRMIFHGIPGGKEISSFASAILAAGGGSKPLDRYTRKDIDKIRKPLKLQICVSLACQHCAQLAASAMRVAWENPLVAAHTIDANLYPDLVRKYQIERVPLLVVNEENLFPGGKTMAELTGLLSKIK